MERNLAVLALQSELNRAIEASDHEIPADEEMRQELLLCLEAIEGTSGLTDGLRDLRQASRVPLALQPEY
jgi:hypothetical protein